jgi:hypothetical protein
MNPAEDSTLISRGLRRAHLWCAGWFRILVLFLLALPGLADGSDGGGDGGVINLPNARSNSGRSVWRMRVVRDDYRPNVVMRMPPEMTNAFAFFHFEEEVVPMPIVEGYLVLDEESLTRLRDARVYSFDITVINAQNEQLLISVELEPNTYRITITVW